MGYEGDGVRPHCTAQERLANPMTPGAARASSARLGGYWQHPATSVVTPSRPRSLQTGLIHHNGLSPATSVVFRWSVARRSLTAAGQ